MTRMTQWRHHRMPRNWAAIPLLLMMMAPIAGAEPTGLDAGTYRPLVISRPASSLGASDAPTGHGPLIGHGDVPEKVRMGGLTDSFLSMIPREPKNAVPPMTWTDGFIDEPSRKDTGYGPTDSGPQRPGPGSVPTPGALLTVGLTGLLCLRRRRAG